MVEIVKPVEVMQVPGQRLVLAIDPTCGIDAVREQIARHSRARSVKAPQARATL